MSETRRALERLLLSAIHSNEEQSSRVSRVLHDQVGQVLSAVGLQLDVLKLDFRQQVPEVVERVDEIQRMLDEAFQQVRALSYDLNPALVERAGLQYALERLVGRYTGTNSIRLLYDPAVKLPLRVGNAWYKIAEHALDNAVRHSGATRIEVIVKASENTASLEVRDNGKGFPVSKTKESAAGLGLLLMQHYAGTSGTSLQIRSSPSRGTTVRTSVPLAAGESSGVIK